MNNPYAVERYAQEKHADRVRKSETIEQASAPPSPDCRRPTFARRLVVAILAARAALARGKR